MVSGDFGQYLRSDSEMMFYVDRWHCDKARMVNGHSSQYLSLLFSGQIL